MCFAPRPRPVSSTADSVSRERPLSLPRGSHGKSLVWSKDGKRLLTGVNTNVLLLLEYPGEDRCVVSLDTSPRPNRAKYQERSSLNTVHPSSLHAGTLKVLGERAKNTFLSHLWMDGKSQASVYVPTQGETYTDACGQRSNRVKHASRREENLRCGQEATQASVYVPTHGAVRLFLVTHTSVNTGALLSCRPYPPPFPRVSNIYPVPVRTHRRRETSSDRRVGAVSPRGRSASPQQQHQSQGSRFDGYSPRSKKPSVRHLVRGHSGSVMALAVFGGVDEYVTAGYDRWVWR